MSNIYPISPDRLKPVGMSDAMAALQRGFKQFGVDFYIVGAVARDIWLSQIYNEPERRATKDLDLAVFINNTAQYEALQAWLLEHEGFISASSSAFCLLYPAPAGNVTVDLMPFGAIADEAGDVYFSGRGMSTFPPSASRRCCRRPPRWLPLPASSGGWSPCPVSSC